MSKLVIVESPAKAKTIKKYLGKDFEVTASMGHIRDLPKSILGVDFDDNYKPKYITIKGKGELIKSLKQQAKKADEIYLATDPDREGEAISWHLAAVLGLDTDEAHRVTFNEITKNAVNEGIKNSRSIDINLVNAQQARRILDRIVGYKLSPFLWSKVRKGLSAGRVQSVAVRLIVDKEKEIRNFVPKEYWNLSAVFFGNKSGTFSAAFYGYKNKKTALKSKEQTDKVLEDLKNAEYRVSDILKKNKKERPTPPFITSTLQQEMSRRLNYSPSVTMRIAQQLYEGVEIKGIGLTGLITYMRTDSFRISNEAQNQAREYIINNFGKEYYPNVPNIYKKKSNSQDAHEAIRPSDVNLTPAKVKDSLTSQQYRLYKLIWDRFVSSQMTPAVYEVNDYIIEANGYIFKTQDKKPVFAGYTVLYQESTDESKEEKISKLPNLSVSDILKLKELISEQKFTQPPARYSDATLIKALEEKGIGRPSTYAPIITTIIDREYVEREKRQLKPTPLGETVTELMMQYFSEIVDEAFTAGMESNLDEVENGKKDWIALLDEFYKPFDRTLNDAEEKLKGQKIKVPVEETDIICENCGKKMVIKYGRNGKFIACPGYPECKNTKSITVETDGICPKCGSKVVAKKTRKKKTYYGCEKHPKCDFMTWDIPLKDKCPNCDNTLFKVKFRGGKVHCLKEDCGYERTNKKNES